MEKPLIKCLGSERTIFFMGLVKNAGKTVAMRKMMSEARKMNRSIAVTSIGRDGEEFDAIYVDFPKPKLEFHAGDIVITSEGLVPDEALYMVMKQFDILTAMGKVVAIEVLKKCEIEVAGPSSNRGVLEVSKWLRGGYNVDLFLIDGALDRKSASVPSICDGVVLSSGAAIAEDMEDVIRHTKDVVDMISLPKTSVSKNTVDLEYSTVHDCIDSLMRRIKSYGLDLNIRLYMKGMLTSRLINKLLEERLLNRCAIVVDSFANLFVPPKRLRTLIKNGLTIEYARKTNLIAVTLNPESPDGKSFDYERFMEGMSEALSHTTVLDVCHPRYPSID